jgi:hypothetical protein
MPPIPTELMRHNKTSLSAIRDLMHRSKQLPYSITSAQGEQRRRHGKPNRLLCLDLENKVEPRVRWTPDFSSSVGIFRL